MPKTTVVSREELERDMGLVIDTSVIQGIYSPEEPHFTDGSKPKLEMMNSYVLVEINELGGQTESGLHFAQGDGDRTEAVAVQGTVVLQVDGKFAVGDIVWFSKFAKHTINVDAHKYVTVKIEDIMMRRQK